MLPQPIRSAIETGNGILFLGAGASYDALKNGNPIRMTADAVKSALSDKFLGGAHKGKSLMTVADYARNEGSLQKVQAYIRELFLELEPAPFHLLIPRFRWRAIVTTNYDLVVERAYASTPDRLQELSPVTRDGTELEDALSEQNSVPYLKLHGCINNYSDTKVPIVLDSNEYAKFTRGRENLIKTFSEWATQSPIIFCGYGLGDENIKELLFDIGDASQNRDAYAYVDLRFDDIQERYWMQRRIVPITNTFKGFLESLDQDIPQAHRVLGSLVDPLSLSILKWIPSHSKPSPLLVQYLNEELIHVMSSWTNRTLVDPKAFYSGLDVSFGPIYEDLDISRVISAQVLESAVLETMQSTVPKLFIIKGYAGSGKSVLAKRIALEASQLLDKPLVVWLREGAVLRPALLLELQELVRERIFIFVDDLIEHDQTFQRFIESLHTSGATVTVVACARTNELAVYGKALYKRITKEFELLDLDDREVLQLLGKLSAAKLLGPLEKYTDADRELFVQRFYDKQLLVALHEITYGDTFENIVVDEFENIVPRSAQQLYLDICTLHQCGVGVRAGLVSRISGIAISGLNAMLGGPLSRVIRADYDHRYRDIVYRSRHQEIARMVFSLAIQDPDARARQLVRVIALIDLDYSSDSKAFFELMRGRKLAKLFDRKELALEVFDAATKTSARPGFLAHQRAIFELNHPNGNLDVALKSLREAEVANQETSFKDASIQHTKANLLRKRALAAPSPIERERYRAEARAILKPQLAKRDNSYPEHLYGQLLLDEIKENFARGPTWAEKTDAEKELDEASIVRVIDELRSLFDQYLFRNPADGPMTLLRSEFLRRIGEYPRAIEILERFHKAHPTDTAISRVLAEALATTDGLEKGIEILRAAALDAPGDMSVNLAFAKLLMKQDEEGNAATIESYLRRSFSDGDAHYEARLLYARYHLLYGDLERGIAELELLKKVYIEQRDRPIATVTLKNGHQREYVGTVISKASEFAFVRSPELRFNVYVHRSNVGGAAWKSLQKGSSVVYTLAFNYRGAVAASATGK